MKAYKHSRQAAHFVCGGRKRVKLAGRLIAACAAALVYAAAFAGCADLERSAARSANNAGGALRSLGNKLFRSSSSARGQTSGGQTETAPPATQRSTRTSTARRSAAPAKKQEQKRDEEPALGGFERPEGL